MSDKKEFRTQYVKIRKQAVNKKSRSIRICEKILSSKYYDQAKTIAMYASLEDEVQTDEMMKKAIADKKRLVLPKVINEHEIRFYEITSFSQLQCGTYQIMEPVTNKEVPLSEIDIMILPGVAFDIEKNRLGYGRGYYDRILKNYKGIRIGICFKEQMCEKVPCDAFDEKVDMIITDD